ncbi:chorismate mutase [Streptomyces odontomachi]|uniref:chorismate mutase n=1 Tax=Streptomyces odontomachi TaxID=2944940 RepID=UPI00210B94ED|nr:chorismate mutase [Streptomyces sp. ODS25]
MSDLDALRDRLDDADRRILEAIADRFEIIRAIAAYKGANDVPMMQPARVSVVQEHYAQAADRIGIPSEHLRSVATSLIAAACDLETRLMADGEPLNTPEHG